MANAKKSLKLTLSEESLSSSSCIETMATNASLGSVLTPAKMVELFEKASLSDVQVFNTIFVQFSYYTCIFFVF